MIMEMETVSLLTRIYITIPGGLEDKLSLYCLDTIKSCISPMYVHYSVSTALLCPWRTKIASNLYREQQKKYPTEIYEECTSLQQK